MHRGSSWEESTRIEIAVHKTAVDKAEAGGLIEPDRSKESYRHLKCGARKKEFQPNFRGV